MRNSKTPFCSSKFQWALESISPKIIDNLGTRSQKRLPGLGLTIARGYKQLMFYNSDSGGQRPI
jgi:hypothetical protein